MHACGCDMINRCAARQYACRNSIVYTPLNLDTLQEFADAGRLDTSCVITMKELRDSGAVRRSIEHGIKLLARVRLAVSRKRPCKTCHHSPRLSC